MSELEGEEGPRFGPLRPGRPVAARPTPPRRMDARPAVELDRGSLIAWGLTAIASVVALVLLVAIWGADPDGIGQGQDSLIVVGAWGAVLLFMIVRDHGRALRLFNLLALLCIVVFAAIVILAIVQFVRLAGEA